MDNKLVFKPQTLTAYNWNRYNLIEDKTYKWDKYSTVPEYLHHYYWNKYSVLKSTEYYIWKVYDGETYIGEIGSFESSAYPQNGEATINGKTLKYVYNRVVDNGNTAYVWDEYSDIATETVINHMWSKYTKTTGNQVSYTWNVYWLKQAKYSGEYSNNEAYAGSQNGSYTMMVSPNRGDVFKHNTLRSIRKDFSPTSKRNDWYYLFDENNGYVTFLKEKPYVVREPFYMNDELFHWKLKETYFNYNGVNGVYRVHYSLITKELLNNLYSQGFYYWIPADYEIEEESEDSQIPGRVNYMISFNGFITTYYELTPYSYFTPDNTGTYENRSELTGVFSHLTTGTYGFKGSPGAINLGDVGDNDILYYFFRSNQRKEIYEQYAHNVTYTTRYLPCYDYEDTNDLTYINSVTEKAFRNLKPASNVAFHNRYYVYVGTQPGNIPDTFVEYIYSTDANLYPDNDVYGDYYYFKEASHLNRIDINHQMGNYLARRYTGNRNIFSDKQYNSITNSWLAYRGTIDMRYNHKWKKYTKISNSLTAHLDKYEWLEFDWNWLPFDDLQAAKAQFVSALNQAIAQNSHRVYIDGTTTYYCPFDYVGEWFDTLIGVSNHNDDEYRRLNYITSDTMPTIINNQIGIIIDYNSQTDSHPNFDRYNASYIKIVNDNNGNLIEAKGYLFAEEPFHLRYTPNTYIEEVISPFYYDYPDWGTSTTWDIDDNLPNFQDGYFYIYQGTVNNDGIRGDYIETVETNRANVYPNDGVAEDYWYVYLPDRYYKEVVAWVKQGKVGSVTALNNIEAYPADGVWPNNFNDGYAHYYYRYIGYTSDYAQGTFIERLKTYIRTSYPDNSFIVNDAWYIYAGETYETTAELTIDNTKLMGGVNYTQEINPSEDLQIGSTSAAQVDFTIYAPDAAAATQYLGKDFEYYVKMNSDNDWRKIGTFVLTTAELPDKQTAHIQGFDFVNRFDVMVDEWLDELTFPLSLGDLFTSLCEYVGCEAYSTSFTNADFMVNDNFEAVQITGRTILQYITEVSGGFCVAEPDGRIRIKHYSQPLLPVNLGSDSYKKYTHEVYTVPVISSVIVRKDDDDEGVESNV